MIPLLDAHIHTHHEPKIKYPKGWTYLSCSACPDDWPDLQIEAENTVPFFGIHPQCPGPERTKSYIDQLDEILLMVPQAGVGEIGVDRRFYPTFPKADQISLFRNQLKIAQKRTRPVVIHHVGTIGTIVAILNDEKLSTPTMIHGWKGSGQMVFELSKLNCYLSLGPGKQWYDDKFLQMIQTIPLDRILLESDWPYSHGILKDYKKVMEELYNRLAQARGIDRTEIIDIVRRNGTVFTNR